MHASQLVGIRLEGNLLFLIKIVQKIFTSAKIWQSCSEEFIGGVTGGATGGTGWKQCGTSGEFKVVSGV